MPLHRDVEVEGSRIGLEAMLQWGRKLRLRHGHPSFSCRFHCPFQRDDPDNAPWYCSEACYALDGFDLTGATYP